ncbi:unnamed protein product [Discosporangium mesarthrocarpum]
MIQTPTISQMWKEAFQSIADDIEQISRDVQGKVADDPLGAIGLGRSLSLLPAASSLSPRLSVDGGADRVGYNSSRGASTTGKGAETTGAEQADPFSRRRTRPGNYWSVGRGQGGRQRGDGKIPPTPQPPPGVGTDQGATGGTGFKCECCDSNETTFEIVNGGGMSSRKTETWGTKDALEVMLRVRCKDCCYTWIEEG